MYRRKKRREHPGMYRRKKIRKNPGRVSAKSYGRRLRKIVSLQLSQSKTRKKRQESHGMRILALHLISQLLSISELTETVAVVSILRCPITTSKERDPFPN